MTCASCTSAVENALLRNPSIAAAKCDLLNSSVTITFDDTRLNKQNLVEVVEDAGFDTSETNRNKDSSQETLISKNAYKVEQSKVEIEALLRSRAMTASRMTTTLLSVEGMTCGACTAAIESQVNPEKVAGLATFSIALLSERAAATHDADLVSAEDLVELIEDCGFDARVISSEPVFVQNQSDAVIKRETVTFRIYGMSGASSVTQIENALNSLRSVISAVVTLNQEEANVVFDHSLIGVRDITDLINSLGYDALLADVNNNAAQLESLARTRESQEWRCAFWRALLFTIPVFVINKILPHFELGRSLTETPILFASLHLGDVMSLILTVPVQFGIGRRFYAVAYKSLKHGSATMDVLVCLGTTAAFTFSLLSMLIALLSSGRSQASTFFDTSGMLITFVTFGRYLENKAKGSTSAALSRLMSLAPSTATIYTNTDSIEKTSDERSVPTELLQVGDVVLLKPGSKVPADGIIIAGESFVDESMITGEAQPLAKKKGDLVVAGTINGRGRLDFRVQRTGRDTQLSQIVRLVQEAQTSKAPIQRFSDTVAGYFVPAIICLGLVTFLGWMILSHILQNPPQIFLHVASGGKTMICLKLCISVIVVACPCALGLATPTAVMVGTGMAASHGILIKGGAVLEVATKVTRVVFDKTGTITIGRMVAHQFRISPAWSASMTNNVWWTIVGAAEQHSEHPTGRAIVDKAKLELNLTETNTIVAGINHFEALTGKGIKCTVELEDFQREKFNVLIGNATCLQEHKVDMIEDERTIAKQEQDGNTCIFVSINGQYTGMISLADQVKGDAYQTIAALKSMGKELAMVTGDQRGAAVQIARQVGISSDMVWAAITPVGKKDIIQRMQEEGEIVAFVGDGINDSPGLAVADVGIAMSSGTDVAIEAADMVLMRKGSILDVPVALLISNAIFRRIKLNLLWACLYNLIAIPFAMGFFLPFGLHLNPMIAGGAMAMSSVSVVCSSLLLRYWQRPAWLDCTGEKRANLPRQPRTFFLPFGQRSRPADDEEMRVMPIL